jgi:hypothetical protein
VGGLPSPGGGNNCIRRVGHSDQRLVSNRGCGNAFVYGHLAVRTFHRRIVARIVFISSAFLWSPGCCAGRVADWPLGGRQSKRWTELPPWPAAHFRPLSVPFRPAFTRNHPENGGPCRTFADLAKDRDMRVFRALSAKHGELGWRRGSESNRRIKVLQTFLSCCQRRDYTRMSDGLSGFRRQS